MAMDNRTIRAGRFAAGMLKKLPRWSLAVGVVMMMAAQATANTPRFPGNMCRLYGPQAQDTSLSPANQKAIGLKNTSSTSQIVTCPLVKNSASDLGQVLIWISAGDANCSLFIRAADGSSYASYGSLVGPASSGYFYVFNQSGGYEATYQTAAIYCSLPSGAAIASYEASEQ